MWASVRPGGVAAGQFQKGLKIIVHGLRRPLPWLRRLVCIQVYTYIVQAEMEGAIAGWLGGLLFG